MNTSFKTRAQKIWKELIKPFLVVLIVLGSFRSAVADWNHVPTGSMKPTILEGDRILVNKLAYGLRMPFTSWRILEWFAPERGDVVVFFSPEDGKRMVKRVTGLPGDHIEMRQNRLFVNDKPVSYEPLDSEIIDQIGAEQQRRYRFAKEKIGTETHPVMITPGEEWLHSFQPVLIPENHFFLMGDNRDNSRDSRWFGPVARSRIVGRGVAVVASFDHENHFLPRWHRFFRRLP